MTHVFRHTGPGPKRLWLILACLALALRVLAPPGFMVGRQTADAPFPIMLCTAQGPMVMPADAPADAGRPDHAPMDPRHADGHCAFAGGHQFVAPASLLAPTPVEFVAYAPPLARKLTHLAPGRGLAAPPLPARGPPILLT